jgi:transglutaminase-like putative cysteine protease
MALVFWMVAAMAAIDQARPAPAWWDAPIEASLDRAPARKAEWVRLLENCPPPHRTGLAYLIKYLPVRDLEGLRPPALAENVALAYQARAEVPWGTGLPEDVFLDAVLPHASVTEPRDSMRGEFHTRYLGLVRDCKTPGQAALALNKALFADYHVRYNTRRRRTDQSAKESIAQGMATCTGLSIMLVEACRSVGVPARLAGISAWPGRGGNHTWVEVWDDGWHFVGAAEPDEKGLDHAWFAGDASKAIKGTPANAIYAVTYRTTGDFFPLVWDAAAQVPGEDVTERYSRSRPGSKTAGPPRLMVEVRDRGERVEADVVILDRKTGALSRVGPSLGPRADVNRHLTCEAPPEGSIFVVARHQGRAAVHAAMVAGSGDTVVRVDLDRPVSDGARAELVRLLADRFAAASTRSAAAAGLLAEIPWDESLRDLAWEAYKASPAHEPLRREFAAKVVTTRDRTSPYLWRHVGQKPGDGWGLVIAMHGGGNVPTAVNDQQWRAMFRRYNEHPEAGGYVYLSLRAPNDTWNGFYDDAICPLVERLIRQFVILGDVNPDKIYALGASHGGYGAFVIGPKVPDRFAAIHASAAAPTPGETLGENLRDVRFTFMVGERDTDYGRAERCLAFEREIQTWRGRYGGYPGRFDWLPGVGHQVPDHDKLAEMFGAGPRKPRPARVVWAQSDDVVRHFYWLEAPHPGPTGRIEALANDNAITLKAEHQDEVVLWLDAPLVDLVRPVTVKKPDGRAVTFSNRPNVEHYCVGLEEKGDPKLAAPLRIAVDLRN